MGRARGLAVDAVGDDELGWNLDGFDETLLVAWDQCWMLVQRA